MKNKRDFLKNLILFTVLPFATPFIFDIPEYLIDIKIKWIIFSILALLYVCFTYKSLLEKEKDKYNEWLQKSIRVAYSGAHNIFEKKRVDLSRETEIHGIDIEHNIFPYDIHSHIIDICQEFKNVIATITQINNEAIDTAFIYKYAYEECTDDDKKWKWIGYREPMSNFSLDDFVKNRDTVFYHIINNNTYYVFGNDKKELANKNMYHLGGRDKMYNKVGSIFGIKIGFGNNSANFVEGIITVSSYGKLFADEKDDPDMLRNMIIDEIFPYYRKLLETELGLLYIRHINK